MVCPNCAAASDSNYCPACGQRLRVKRITLKEGFLDFWGRIYGFDSMFPRTMRDLTLRPGLAAKRYIERNRTAYYGPVGYYFLMITLVFLVASLLGIDFSEVLIGRSRELAGPPPAGGPAEAQHRMQMLVLDNFRIFMFTMVVFQALSLKIYFRKSGYNLLEHSVLAFFTMGHLYWLTILDLIIVKIFGKGVSFAVVLPVNMLYYAFGVMGLYNYQRPVKAYVKGVFAFLTGYIGFIFVIIVITIAYFVLDPEMRELIRPKK